MSKKSLLRIFLLFLAGLAFFSKIALSQNALQPKDLAQSITKTCQTSNNVWICYVEEFKKFSNNHDISQTISVLKEVQAQDRQAMECHIIAHYVAGAEVKKDPTNWQNVLQKVDKEMCFGGFLHGVVEGHQATDPNFKVDYKTILEMCTSESLNEEIRCVHGLGHVLLIQQEANLDQAINICKDLPYSGSRHVCYTGIFMEHVIKRNLKDHGLVSNWYFSPNNVKSLEKTCNSYSDQQIKNACWQQMGYAYLITQNSNPGSIFKECSKSQDLQTQMVCYLNGSIVLVNLNRLSEESVGSICMPFSTSQDAYDSCIGTTVVLLVFQGNIAQMKTLCQNSPEGQIDYCYQKSITILKDNATKQRLEDFCNSTPEKYKSLCS